MNQGKDKKPRTTYELVAAAIGRLADILSGKSLRRMKELEAMMKYWHKEESSALDRAEEAIACGDMERADMWVKRWREARLRCEKDFRRPAMELTGKPNPFNTNSKPKNQKN